MNIKVPLTNIYTPQFITIRLFVPSSKTRIASTVHFFGKLLFVGIAQGLTVFSREQNREIKKIYGFNGDEMQPLYVAPGKISTTLTLERVVFHKSDLLQELGCLRGNLLTQENPFVIAEDQYILYNPINKKEPEVTLGRTIFYHDCWLVNNPIEYDIMDDNLILIPSFTVECGKVITSEETSTTIYEDVRNFIVQKFKEIF